VGGDKRHEFAQLETIYLPIAIAVFAIVCLFVLYAFLRRRREPSQRKENNPVELAYASLLLLITVVLIYLSFTTEDKTDAVAKTPGLVIKATAGQWNWRFSYPRYGVTVVSTPTHPAEFAVPTNTAVNFTGTSTDVIHSFYVPERRFKRDFFPGSNSTFTLMWPKPVSRDLGECAEYCGYLHAHMSFYVHAMPPDQFRAWIGAHR
jgi:cytochrome c oxidase subunit II